MHLWKEELDAKFLKVRDCPLPEVQQVVPKIECELREIIFLSTLMAAMGSREQPETEEYAAASHNPVGGVPLVNLVRFSSTTTEPQPESAASIAIRRPAGPAPTTSTSIEPQALLTIARACSTLTSIFSKNPCPTPTPHIPNTDAAHPQHTSAMPSVAHRSIHKTVRDL